MGFVKKGKGKIIEVVKEENIEKLNNEINKEEENEDEKEDEDEDKEHKEERSK